MADHHASRRGGGARSILEQRQAVVGHSRVPPVTGQAYGHLVTGQQVFVCSSGVWANKLSTLERIDDVVSATDGFASFVMVRSLGRVFCG